MRNISGILRDRVESQRRKCASCGAAEESQTWDSGIKNQSSSRSGISGEMIFRRCHSCWSFDFLETESYKDAGPTALQQKLHL
jgi:hypothetical protein